MKDVNIKFHAALLCSLLCAIFWGCSDNDDKKDYIAEKSGHTRGSTIDLTIFNMPQILAWLLIPDDCQHQTL